MNYPQGILDLEALVNSQRPSVSLPNFSSAMRPLQYSSNLSKEAQNFQTSMGYFQNQAYRTHARDEQDFSMYESPHMNRIEENLRYQYPNNNALLDYMQQRAIPNNVQIMSANPQIPPLRGERALLEEAHKKRNVRPQSLNAASKSLPPNMDIINLESDETLAQMLHSARGNKDLMMVNNRALQYGLSSDEALSQALLLNSLNYGKTNTDYLMSQLPIDNLCNGMSEYDMISLNPLLMNAISANNSIDNLYKQMQRELLPSGLGQEQQLLLQLGQAGHNIMPEALSVKPKKPLLNQEPILIDDSPEQDTYIPMVNMNPEKERRVVKEEFLTKPSKPYPGFEEIDDRRIMEMYPQYFQDHLKMRPTQTLNNKRFLNDRDPEMQLMGSPEKKFETNNGMGVRTNPNPIANHTMTSNPNMVTKTAKKESKLPMKKEKPPVVMPKERPEVVKQDPVKQAPASLGMNVQVSLPPQMAKKPEPQVQVQDFKRESKQADIMINNNNNKQKEIIQAKKVQKITIDKISLPESAVVQQAEPVESVMKAKQSPTTLHLHKKHGQIQLNAQQGPVEQVNRQPFQLKLVSGPVVKVESSTEPSVLSNEHTQVQPLMMMMMNPLNVNQSPEKLIEFKESPYQSLAVEPFEEEKLSANGDTPVPNKEKTGGRRKKTEPTEVNTEPVKKERKMNKLQMIRFAYQAYLEEIKKPYKISIHIDPTNPDEKIVYAKIGEGYQVDVDSVLYNRQFTKKHNQIAPVWNPDSIHPRKLEEYYQRFGQIIGQKITNEESALKNLQKFDMDVEKALDNASRNKLYYQNSFRLDQRVLRNRAPYVS